MILVVGATGFLGSEICRQLHVGQGIRNTGAVHVVQDLHATQKFD